MHIGTVILFSMINLLDHRAKTYFANFLMSLQDENHLTHDDEVDKARIVCAAGLFNPLDCRFQLRWLDSYLLQLPACPVLRQYLKPNAPIIGSKCGPWFHFMLALTRDLRFAILRGTDMKRSINQPTGIFPRDDKKAITHIGLRLPAELYVMITDGCNLTCRHCWPRAKDTAAAVSIGPSNLQALVGNFIRLGVNTLILTGGEPLTHPDCMSMLARSAEQTGISEVWLQTNGTLLTPGCVAQINTLPRDKIRIQVSLDGAHPATHDRLRGTDRFGQTVDGVQRLTRMGWGPAIRLAFTETESSVDDLPDLLNLANELGVGQVVSGCLVKKGRAGSDTGLKLPRPDQYESLLTRYHQDQAFQQQYHRLANFSAIEWFNGRAFPIDNQCQCMRMPYVTATGDLYPCNMLPEDRWRIANVFKRPFTEIIDALLTRWRGIPDVYRRRREMQSCRSCIGGEHCGGGCPGRVMDGVTDDNLPEDRCTLRKTVYHYSKESE